MANTINKLKKIYVVNESSDGSKELVEIFDANEQIQSAVEAAKEAVKSSAPTPAPQIGVSVPPFIEATELPATIDFDNFDLELSSHQFTASDVELKVYLSAGSMITMLVRFKTLEGGSASETHIKDATVPIAKIDITKLTEIGRNIEFITQPLSLNGGSFSFLLEQNGNYVDVYLNSQGSQTLSGLRKYIAESEDNKGYAKIFYASNFNILQGLFRLVDTL